MSPRAVCRAPFAGLIFLSACVKVGPDYETPAVAVPSNYSTLPPAEFSAANTGAATASTEDFPEFPGAQDIIIPRGVNGGPVDVAQMGVWWRGLGDSQLDGLIDRALAGSLDLKTAMARVREARARRGGARSQRLPTVDATGSATRNRLGTLSNEQEFGLYEAGFDAGWEVDLFGRVARTVEQAEAALGASEEGYRNTLVTLLAEVALNYTEIRTIQSRLDVAEANRDSQQDTLRLVTLRFDAGESSRLEVEQATANLETTKSTIPQLRSLLQQAKNRIAVLIGEPPGSLDTDLALRRPVPTPPANIAVGIPADVIRRRPDIRRAERNLAAQTAKVGVAVADLYPRLTLLGSIGIESLDAVGFSGAPSTTFGIGPSVSWRIFDRNAIRNNIEAESAVQEQALIAYEAAILEALRDVENAIVAYSQEQARRDRLLAAEAAASRAVSVAEAQFQAGETDFLNVLDAQRSRLKLQDELAASEAEITTDVIMLFKALGGGWTSLAPEGGVITSLPMAPTSDLVTLPADATELTN